MRPVYLLAGRVGEQGDATAGEDVQAEVATAFGPLEGEGSRPRSRFSIRLAIESREPAGLRWTAARPRASGVAPAGADQQDQGVRTPWAVIHSIEAWWARDAAG